MVPCKSDEQMVQNRNDSGICEDVETAQMPNHLVDTIRMKIRYNCVKSDYLSLVHSHLKSVSQQPSGSRGSEPLDESVLELPAYDTVVPCAPTRDFEVVDSAALPVIYSDVHQPSERIGRSQRLKLAVREFTVEKYLAYL